MDIKKFDKKRWTQKIVFLSEDSIIMDLTAVHWYHLVKFKCMHILRKLWGVRFGADVANEKWSKMYFSWARLWMFHELAGLRLDYQPVGSGNLSVWANECLTLTTCRYVYCRIIHIQTVLTSFGPGWTGCRPNLLYKLCGGYWLSFFVPWERDHYKNSLKTQYGEKVHRYLSILILY